MGQTYLMGHLGVHKKPFKSLDFITSPFKLWIMGLGLCAVNLILFTLRCGLVSGRGAVEGVKVRVVAVKSLHPLTCA